MKLHKDLREFIELLNSHKADYVIVGGHAVAYHGYPRYTGDVDFFIRPTEENAQLIIDSMHEFGFTDLDLKAKDLTEPNKILQLGRPPNRIDLLTSISGCNFDEVWGNRIESMLDDIPVNFIGKQNLITNKRSSGRSKDLLDVEKIESRDPNK
jgi:predicted nucleotidyltransferase